MSNELAKITRRRDPKLIPLPRQFAIELGKKSGGGRGTGMLPGPLFKDVGQHAPFMGGRKSRVRAVLTAMRFAFASLFKRIVRHFT